MKPAYPRSDSFSAPLRADHRVRHADDWLVAAMKPEPLQAARGDDDVMSQPPPTIANIDIGVVAWNRQVIAAQRRWSKLSAADLLKVEGRSDRLAELLHRHYSLGKSQADREIGAFFLGTV
ncbi:hypothetical protein [Hydrocarboniphaga sp.]|uniref:hypothetical protein n=1 Tax=Hydrocarboniphaga sp. TaxID=2033016 RepID=UPI003D1184FE